jgi:hypothetical protein
VAICGAKIRGKDEWCQREATAPNGKCANHWRRAEANRKTASLRHVQLKATGQPTRFYENTPEHSEKLREARLGKSHSDETKAAIGEGRSRAHRARQQREYDARIEAHRALLESVGPPNCQFNELPRARSAVHGNLFKARGKRQ